MYEPVVKCACLLWNGWKSTCGSQRAMNRKCFSSSHRIKKFRYYQNRQRTKILFLLGIESYMSAHDRIDWLHTNYIMVMMWTFHQFQRFFSIHWDLIIIIVFIILRNIVNVRFEQNLNPLTKRGQTKTPRDPRIPSLLASGVNSGHCI